MSHSYSLHYTMHPSALLSLDYRYSDKYLLSTYFVPYFESEMLGDLPRVTLQACVRVWMPTVEHSFAFPPSHITSPKCCTFSNSFQSRTKEVWWGLDRQDRWWVMWKKEKLMTPLNELITAVILKLESASGLPGGIVKTQIAGPCSQSFWFTRTGVGYENMHL